MTRYIAFVLLLITPAISQAGIVVSIGPTTAGENTNEFLVPILFENTSVDVLELQGFTMTLNVTPAVNSGLAILGEEVNTIFDPLFTNVDTSLGDQGIFVLTASAGFGFPEMPTVNLPGMSEITVATLSANIGGGTSDDFMITPQFGGSNDELLDGSGFNLVTDPTFSITSQSGTVSAVPEPSSGMIMLALSTLAVLFRKER